MREVVLTGIRKLALQDAPWPELKNDCDVRIRVETVGVCGSDIHYYTGGRIGDQVVQFPFRIGHECAGIIDAIGPGVKGLRVGERVAIDPSVSCGGCAECMRGRAHTCRQNRFLGCPGQLPGSLAEYIVMPAENCFPVGEMTPEEAAFVEPLTIGYYTVQFLKNQPVTTLAILGAGPIGLSVLLAARAAGIRHILVSDLRDYRLALARKMGAGWTGNPCREAIPAQVAALDVPVDAVVECCGQQPALDDAIELVRPGGTVLVVGIPESDRVSFDPHKMRRKEITLQNVRRQNGCTPAAIALIRKKKVDGTLMITHRFSLEETPAAFELVAEYRDGVLKAMIQIT